MDSLLCRLCYRNFFDSLVDLCIHIHFLCFLTIAAAGFGVAMIQFIITIYVHNINPFSRFSSTLLLSSLTLKIFSDIRVSFENNNNTRITIISACLLCLLTNSFNIRSTYRTLPWSTILYKPRLSNS